MRSPTRPSVEAQAIEAELICKCAYVADLVDDPTAMVPIRSPIPRTIVRHEANAQIDVQLLAWPPHKTTAGRAMERKDREPLWITPDRERERPTVRRLERPQRFAHPPSVEQSGSGLQQLCRYIASTSCSWSQERYA
jgi:hypothetical protein